jgi:hypothetical protein
MKKTISLILPVLIAVPVLLFGQDTTFNIHQEPVVAKQSFGKILIVPTILIGYGAASLRSQGLKNLNNHFNEEIYLESPHKAFHLDNYLQYAPGALVYGLNMVGIKGKHNFADRTAIYVMSNIIMGGTVMASKHLTQEWRPDRSDRLSFPSGHTATAFAAAEFLRQEYKDVSPWYGVAGYAMAATTGYLRMYNNKHWLGDVVAGAGVGILSTDIAYYIYPSVKKLFVKKETNGTTIILPTYQQGTVGISLVHIFN